MTCSEFEAQIDLDGAGQETAAHMAECERCGALAGRIAFVADELRVLAAASSNGPGAGLEARLREGFRGVQLERAHVAQPSAPRRPRAWWPVWAAAAAVALLAGAFLARLWFMPAPASAAPERAAAPPTNVELTPAAAPVPEPEPRTSVPAVQRIAAASPPRRVAPRDARPQTPETPSHPVEITTEFIPLVSANGLASLEGGGQVVRMELPRATLASLGLQMNMERVDQPITADVLLGNDGVARAIRFVQTQGSTERRMK